MAVDGRDAGEACRRGGGARGAALLAAARPPAGRLHSSRRELCSQPAGVNRLRAGGVRRRGQGRGGAARLGDERRRAGQLHLLGPGLGREVSPRAVLARRLSLPVHRLRVQPRVLLRQPSGGPPSPPAPPAPCERRLFTAPCREQEDDALSSSSLALGEPLLWRAIDPALLRRLTPLPAPRLTAPASQDGRVGREVALEAQLRRRLEAHRASLGLATSWDTALESTLGPTTRCAEMRRDAPRCAEMRRDAPRCAEMRRDAPRCALESSAPPSTRLEAQSSSRE